MAAGQSYEISASAMYEGSGQQNMAIKMIYTDANGTDHYDQVAAAQATAGQWVEMKGNYTVPNGATGMILYVEMPNAGTDQTYYIDDVVIKGEKTEIQLDDKFESDFDNNSTQKWNGRGSAKAGTLHQVRPQRHDQPVCLRQNPAVERRNTQCVRHHGGRRLLQSRHLRSL